MINRPKYIYVNMDDREDGCCPVESSLKDTGKFFDFSTCTKYIRADISIAKDLKKDVLQIALTRLVEEYCDYMKVNNLGDPEKQHNIKLAREALSWPEEV